MYFRNKHSVTCRPFLGNEWTNTFPGILKRERYILGNELVAVDSTGVSMDTNYQQTFPSIPLRNIIGLSDKKQVIRTWVVNERSVSSLVGQTRMESVIVQVCRNQTRMERVKIEQVRLRSYCELL
jgi:hypothetical protein